MQKFSPHDKQIIQIMLHTIWLNQRRKPQFKLFNSSKENLNQILVIIELHDEVIFLKIRCLICRYILDL